MSMHWTDHRTRGLRAGPDGGRSEIASLDDSALLPVQVFRLLLVMLLLFTAAGAQAASSDLGPKRSKTLRVDSRRLVHWIVATNEDVVDQQYAVEAAGHVVEAEKGLYEPVWMSSGGRERERRRRSSTEYTAIFNAAETELSETSSYVETGVKFPLPTGGEASVNYRFSDLQSNLFTEEIEHEYTSQLDLKLKQPLLRGYGRKFTETGKRVALLEEEAAKMSLRQELLHTAGDAARLYWQLYRAQEVLRIRRFALDSANKLLEDLRLWVEKGRAARAELLEARAAIADREAELLRAKQVMTQVLTEICIQLNVPEQEVADFHLEPAQLPDFGTLKDQGTEERIAYALNYHPEYLLLDIRRKQARERHDYARNQEKPKLDLTLGYGFDNLDSDYGRAFDESMSSDYHDWYAGLSLEIPLGGNIRADAEARAQRVRVDRVKHRRRALRNRLKNDIQGRWEQLQRAYEEVHEVEASVDLHEKLLAVERQLFDRGRTRLRDVIEREIVLNDTRQRFVETAARVEIARVALMVAEGRLLEEYEIALE